MEPLRVELADKKIKEYGANEYTFVLVSLNVWLGAQENGLAGNLQRIRAGPPIC